MTNDRKPTDSKGFKKLTPGECSTRGALLVKDIKEALDIAEGRPEESSYNSMNYSALSSLDDGNGGPIGTYLGGSYGAVQMYNRRRRMVRGFRRAGLPTQDQDLSSCITTNVELTNDKFTFSFYRKRDGDSPELQRLAKEFIGCKEIALLNAYCIMHLRRQSAPIEAKETFHKIWENYARELINLLDIRWLISTMTTFGDHGKTVEQKVAGSMFTVFFGMMKLYEWERIVSRPPPRYFRPAASHTMPLGISSFSMKFGDLDYNLIARLHLAADADPLMSEIGHHMLAMLNSDESNIFRRLSKVKAAR